MSNQLILISGPSKEAMFDCLRLGFFAKELRTVEFWGKSSAKGRILKSSLRIKIEGIHSTRASYIWFFWGRVENKPGKPYVFGKWNIEQRHGIAEFKETSFFEASIGNIKLLHQADYDTGNCIYCRKPSEEWSPMEECLNHHLGPLI